MMNIRIKNIGIIKDSIIELNGLTVITGENGTGKTTIGKTLFSLISATENLNESALEHKKIYTMNILRRILEECGIYEFRLARSYEFNDFAYEEQKSSIQMVLLNDYSRLKSLNDIISFINNFYNELEELKENELPKLNNINRKVRYYNSKQLWENFKLNKNKFLCKLIELKQTLTKDDSLVSYANAKILNTLNMEFFSQIGPINNSNLKSEIVIDNGTIKNYEVSIKKGEIEDKSSFNLNAFNNCLLIDDINVINDMNLFHISKERMNRASRIYYDIDNFIEMTKAYSKKDNHRDYLLSGLTKKVNEYEQSVYKEKTNDILNLIKKAFDDNVTFIDGKYLCEGNKLDIRNLASGSKLFLILKLLLEKGLLDDKSLLILDEPENHLHPGWINLLVEVIVLMQKYLNVTILLTTHSPNLLLAIDTISKKYRLKEKFNPYVAISEDNGNYVNFKNIKENIEEAFAHLIRPYLEMDALRDSIQ